MRSFGATGKRIIMEAQEGAKRLLSITRVFSTSEDGITRSLNRPEAASDQLLASITKDYGHYQCSRSFFLSLHFLDATKRLYKRMCPSVRRAKDNAFVLRPAWKDQLPCFLLPSPLPIPFHAVTAPHGIAFYFFHDLHDAMSLAG